MALNLKNRERKLKKKEKKNHKKQKGKKRQILLNFSLFENSWRKIE
jgi:hypothetical protein